MVERKGGLGGFGAIASDNTDQRMGKYHPHRVVSRMENYFTDETIVTCRVCKATWRHPRRDPWGSAPKECVKRG